VLTSALITDILFPLSKFSVHRSLLQRLVIECRGFDGFGGSVSRSSIVNS
jgi:hypothetical protein